MSQKDWIAVEELAELCPHRMVLWGVVKGHSAVQVWRGGALKPELETQTGLNVTSFHMSTFHLGSYSNPNCIIVLWAGSGVTFRDIGLMICTEVFQFMRQDDMSSDSMSRSPTATPSKVLQPFSSASIVQIRYWVRGKLLNEPLRKKESCLCVFDEDTEHHCIDEILVLKAEQAAAFVQKYVDAHIPSINMHVNLLYGYCPISCNNAKHVTWLTVLRP